MVFQTIKGKKVSPIIHTRNIVKGEPHVEIHIGTDSQRQGSNIIYMLLLWLTATPLGGFITYIAKKLSLLLKMIGLVCG